MPWRCWPRPATDARAAVEAAEQEAYALVEQVGYLPLAVKIAGRRLDSQARVTGHGQAIARLAGELQARLLSLKVAGRRAGIDERELSLEAVIALSYDHLPDGDTQRAFRRLAVFGGQPLDFDAAAAAGLWQIQASDAGDRLAQLIDAGLLEVAHAGGQRALLAPPNHRRLRRRSPGRERRRATRRRVGARQALRKRRRRLG